ncbi:hypothetical protein Tco_0619778 [Tanacetum coccineum]
MWYATLCKGDAEAPRNQETCEEQGSLQVGLARKQETFSSSKCLSVQFVWLSYDWSDQAEEGPTLILTSHGIILHQVQLLVSVSEPIVEKPTIETNEPKTKMETQLLRIRVNAVGTKLQLLMDKRLIEDIDCCCYETDPILQIMKNLMEDLLPLEVILKEGKLLGKVNKKLGSGPNWHFDIDALTKSMNYKPVVVGNQSNGNAGTKACNDADSKSSPDAGFKPSGRRKRRMIKIQGMKIVRFQVQRKVNVVDPKSSIKLPNGPNMSELEDIVYSNDDEDVGAEADINYLDAFMLMDVKVLFFLNSLAWYETLSTLFVGTMVFPKRGKDDKTYLSEESKVKFVSTSVMLMIAFVVLQRSHYARVLKDDAKETRYDTEILKKFGFTDVKTAKTLWKPIILCSKMQMVKIDYKSQFRIENPQQGLSIPRCRWSWQCQKQTVVANFTTEAKYIATSNCFAFLEKPTESEGFEEIVDFLNANPIKYALTVNPIIYCSCVKQFWDTVKAKTVNREVQLQALVDKKKVEGSEIHVCNYDPTFASPSFLDHASLPNLRDENVPTTSNDPLLSGEDRLKLTELMDLCTNLQKKVLDLEKAKTAQDSEIQSSIREKGHTVTLIDETQGRNDDNLMFDTGVLDEQEVEVEKVVSTAEVTTESANAACQLVVDELRPGLGC